MLLGLLFVDELILSFLSTWVTDICRQTNVCRAINLGFNVQAVLCFDKHPYTFPSCSGSLETQNVKMTVYFHQATSNHNPFLRLVQTVGVTSAAVLNFHYRRGESKMNLLFLITKNQPCWMYLLLQVWFLSQTQVRSIQFTSRMKLQQHIWERAHSEWSPLQKSQNVLTSFLNHIQLGNACLVNHM